MENSSKNVAVFLGLAFVSGLIGGFAGDRLYNTNFKIESGKLIVDHVYIEDSQVVQAINKVDPAVVSIVTSDNLDSKSLIIPKKDEIYGGTGFIVDASGLVLTNKHVILDKKANYKVVLIDGSEYLAKFLSEDPFDDVAVLKIQSEKVNFPVVTLGDSENLQIGQKVVAIGNALALYGNTVTAGIISAKGREVEAYNDYGAIQNMTGLIQTDAAINLGNSGGPLVNLDGEVIAMNAAVQESANSIGFAIPIDDLKPIIASVKKNGEIVRPVLGVNFVMMTKSEAQDLDKTLDHGALLVVNDRNGRSAIQKGGAADKAGLKDMDVVLSVNSIPVTLENPLHKIIRNYNPGDVVTFQVWRNGKISEFKLTLKSNKDK
ncbi:MAG: trypsin-like peptidase domain-containing protein [Candidatus Peregrinibacteria bacterium]|nr:trypsin-like peptidase domain-containing protein [Candidatus Peregrinibacteria bacterium]